MDEGTQGAIRVRIRVRGNFAHKSFSENIHSSPVGDARPMRCMPMRSTHEIHAYEIHAYEIHMHAYEIHAYETHAHDAYPFTGNKL